MQLVDSCSSKEFNVDSHSLLNCRKGMVLAAMAEAFTEVLKAAFWTEKC